MDAVVEVLGILNFWGLKLTSGELADWFPSDGKFKAVVFETFASEPKFQLEGPFESLDAAEKRFQSDPACNTPIHEGGQTNLKVYIFDHDGKCVKQFGSV